MDIINNENNQKAKGMNLNSLKANAVYDSIVADNKSIQNLQSNNTYEVAHFADSKEMEEGIERILKDNGIM